MQHQTLPDPALHRVRSADRSDVAIPCTVLRIELPECQGEVRNLSPGGALLIASEALPANSFVSLRFGDWEPVSAQVKWSDGEQCGCRFVRSLTVRQYLRLRQGDAFEATAPEKTSLFDKVRNLLPRKAA
jgi:hypothetical protein